MAYGLTWQMLRIAKIPRYLKKFEETRWLQGSAYLRSRYGEMLPKEHPRYLNQFEAKAYSQHGEDGLLLEIFKEIGTTNKTFVEIGVENGRECNTASLAINFGWRGIQIEGNRAHVESAREFYRTMIPDRLDAVMSVNLWVTRDNVDPTLAQHGISGPIDLLSIDIDGNDYWVWHDIESIDPRVVVIEYNASFGPERSVTVPYRADFAKREYHEDGTYHGVSLEALTRLAKRKGYSLIGCESYGNNAFFVKDSELGDKFRRFAPQEVWFPPVERGMRGQSVEDQWEQIKALPLETIE